MPEKPVQEFSGRSMDANAQFQLSSSENNASPSARQHLSHPDHLSSLTQEQ